MSVVNRESKKKRGVRIGQTRKMKQTKRTKNFLHTHTHTQTYLAPAGPPRVAHFPVSFIGVNAHNLHGMVNLVAALGHDAATVARPVIGINADRERTRGADVGRHGGLDGGGGAACDLVIVVEGHDLGRRVGLANTRDTC